MIKNGTTKNRFLTVPALHDAGLLYKRLRAEHLHVSRRQP